MCVGVAEAMHFDGTEIGGGMPLQVSQFVSAARSEELLGQIFPCSGPQFPLEGMMCALDHL